MTKKNSKSNFEKKLGRLEEISAMLESEDIGLEDAIKLYEEGIGLSRECMAALKHAELRITELKENLDNISSEEDSAEE